MSRRPPEPRVTMATELRNPLMKGKSQDVEDISLENLDDLLAQLSQAELEELNGDFDPDVSRSCTPPSADLL